MIMHKSEANNIFHFVPYVTFIQAHGWLRLMAIFDGLTDAENMTSYECLCTLIYTQLRNLDCLVMCCESPWLFYGNGMLRVFVMFHTVILIFVKFNKLLNC